MLSTAEAQHLALSGLLDGAMTELAHELQAEPARPPRIGRYHIRRLIGIGGMGAVYEAEQEHPHRTVALKLMRGGLLSRTAAARFKFEAEVLGRLQHPGIAQIYEAGTHCELEAPSVGGDQAEAAAGTPYFVMEHIENAQPITHFAARCNLDLRQRLALFIKVCDAVHYGHQKGVIHRDLKPENIVVSQVPSGSSVDAQPKIIDFGVARATNADVAMATQVTSAGQIVGTVQYMSPEQCHGDVGDLDTRSDVYSLGVIMYELICGQLPYDVRGTSMIGATRMVQEHEPERPGAINRRLRGDVETVILKAIEKDRHRRYQSAADLRDDIRRCIEGEPIMGRRPGTFAKVGRFARRHPLIATACACALMVSGTAASTWMVVNHIRSRPYRIEIDRDGKGVRLLSYSNETLREWFDPRGVNAVGPLTGPGGAVVVVGFNGLGAGPGAASLQAFAVARRDEPIWSMRIQPEDLPHELQTRPEVRAENFRVSTLSAYDIFPEVPGEEIVVSFQGHPFTHSVVRVLDHAGKILFQFWHDGNVTSTYWMPEVELLLCTGLNGEAYFEQRGLRRRVMQRHPRVIFAVRPFLGRVERDWLLTHPKDGEFGAAWYKTFSEDTPDVDFRVHFAKSLALSATTGDIQIDFDCRACTLAWTIGAGGEFLSEEPIISDGFNLSAEAPDPRSFRLIDLPEILPEWRELCGPGRRGVPVH